MVDSTISTTTCQNNRGRIIGTVIVLRKKLFRRYPQVRASRKYVGFMVSKVRIRFSDGYLNYGRKELLNTVIRVKIRSEDEQIKELESENKRLKIALADAVLAKDVLESLIEEVDSLYGTDVKKKLGHQRSADVRKKNINR